MLVHVRVTTHFSLWLIHNVVWVLRGLCPLIWERERERERESGREGEYVCVCGCLHPLSCPGVPQEPPGGGGWWGGVLSVLWSRCPRHSSTDTRSGMHIINPRRAWAARVTVVVRVCVCVSVCLSVTPLLECSFVSQTIYTTYLTGNEGQKFLNGFLWKCSVAKLERFHHCTTNASIRHFITAENAHTHRLDRVRLLCVSWRHKKTQRRACIDSRILSTAVAIQCKTLCELLAGETMSKRIPNSPAHQLAVPRVRSSPRVCT